MTAYNISDKVKQFVRTRSSQVGYPFDSPHPEHILNATRSRHARKQSLSDWRKLYVLNKTVTNDAVTTNSNIQNKQIDKNYHHFSEKHRPGSKHTCSTFQKQRSKTRKSLIDFALVQHSYENQIFEEPRAKTAKVKQYCRSRGFNHEKFDMTKISDPNVENEMEKVNTPVPNENWKIRPFSKAKIRPSAIMKPIYPLILKRETGLRFYSRDWPIN